MYVIGGSALSPPTRPIDQAFEIPDWRGQNQGLEPISVFDWHFQRRPIRCSSSWRCWKSSLISCLEIAGAIAEIRGLLGESDGCAVQSLVRAGSGKSLHCFASITDMLKRDPLGEADHFFIAEAGDVYCAEVAGVRLGVEWVLWIEGRVILMSWRMSFWPSVEGRPFRR